jgi:hypothetical protein
MWKFNLTVSIEMQVYKTLIGTNVPFDVPLRSHEGLLDLDGLQPKKA